MLRILSGSVFLLGVLVSLPGVAADAVIIGVYKDCRVISSTVMIQPTAIDDIDTQNAAAKAEALAATTGFEAALPEMVKLLERSGIRDTEIRRQGYLGCKTPGSGKYVEAVGSYCGVQLVNAEIRVDGKLFVREANPEQSLEQFVDGAVAKLQRDGIWDRPRVTIETAADCPPEEEQAEAVRRRSA